MNTNVKTRLGGMVSLVSVVVFLMLSMNLQRYWWFFMFVGYLGLAVFTFVWWTWKDKP